MDTLTDSLGRELRWRPRNPKGTEPVITDLVRKIFEIIERHGFGTSAYLHDFVGGNEDHLLRRLPRLYDWGYLDHFPQQENSFPNRIRHIIYGNTDKARRVLAQSCIVERNDPFHHRFMSACVGLSLESEFIRRGFTYVPRNEVLDGRVLKVPLPEFGKRASLEPDDLFAIKNPEGYKRRYVVEIDRSNEPIVGLERHSSLEKKLNYYKELFDQELYKNWGIKNFTILFITTREDNLKGFFDLINKREQPAITSRVIGKVYPTFGTNTSDWLVPPELLTDILDPWLTPSGELFDITK